MRLEAVVALADTLSPSSFELLTRTLRDDELPLFLRSAAAWALGCHGSDAAARVLVEAFDDVDTAVKDEAPTAMTQIGEACSASLLWGLEHTSADIASGSAEVLRRVADVPIERIRRLATSAEPKASAVWTLAQSPTWLGGAAHRID